MEMKNREACFELLVYLITSAGGIKGEPEIYAPLRLIEAAQRLCRIMEAEGDTEQKGIGELIALIEEGKQKSMSDPDGFYTMIGAASEKLIDCME